MQSAAGTQKKWRWGQTPAHQQQLAWFPLPAMLIGALAASPSSGEFALAEAMEWGRGNTMLGFHHPCPFQRCTWLWLSLQPGVPDMTSGLELSRSSELTPHKPHQFWVDTEDAPAWSRSERMWSGRGFSVGGFLRGATSCAPIGGRSAKASPNLSCCSLY